MPRRPRRSAGGYFYHVTNRAGGTEPIFTTPKDFLVFEQILEGVHQRIDARLLAYCLLPESWHMLLWPRADGDLSEFMRLLTVTHVQRWHAAHGTAGTGSLYQSRFKAFPVQKGEPLLSVCRYIESAALRAKKVKKAENWRWCSLWHRLNKSKEITFAKRPITRPNNWKTLVNRSIEEQELAALDNSLLRDAPYGTPRWQKATAVRLGLESTLRARGRPKKVGKKS